MIDIDENLIRDTLSAVRKIGAEDAVILHSGYTERTDRWQNAEIAHTSAASETLELFVNIDGAVATADLLHNRAFLLDKSGLKDIAVNTVQAARIAAAWGVRFAAPSLRTWLGMSSAPAVRIQTDESRHCPAYPDKDACTAHCFAPACIADDTFNPAQVYQDLCTKHIRSHPGLHVALDVHTSNIESIFFTHDDTVPAVRIETRIEQTLRFDENHRSRELKLPAFLFDGIILDDMAPELGYWLSAADIVPGFIRSNATAADSKDAPHNRHRVLLSPWASAMLAHEADHLRAQLGQSGIIIDRDAALMTPPSRSNCRGFAIRTASGDLPEDTLLFRNLYTPAFIVDAPSRWIRRNNRLLDVRFEIAAACSKTAGYEQHYPAISMRFDLLDMWKTARIVAAPAKRIALPCSGHYTAVEAPWLEVDFLNIIN